MKKAKKESKTNLITIRVSENEKQNISQKAKEQNLSISQFLLNAAKNQQVVINPKGKEIAEMLYIVHEELNNKEFYPYCKMQDLQDKITKRVIMEI